MSKTLFNLSAEILQLEAQLDEETLTDERRQALVDEWLNAQGDVETKLDNYAALITDLDARAEARSTEARRLVALANADANQAADLRDRLKYYFQRHELKRFETARYKLTLAGHGGKAPLFMPSSWEQDPGSAPGAFQQVVIQLDRQAIRAALEAGIEVGGCGFGERGSSIRIR